MTQVIHIRDKRPGDVYIGRGSPFGNPFILDKDGSRAEVIKLFKEYFYTRLRKSPEFASQVKSLKGKRLACYCKPKACHGDIIAEYLNTREDE